MLGGKKGRPEFQDWRNRREGVFEIFLDQEATRVIYSLFLPEVSSALWLTHRSTPHFRESCLRTECSLSPEE